MRRYTAMLPYASSLCATLNHSHDARGRGPKNVCTVSVAFAAVVPSYTASHMSQDCFSTAIRSALDVFDPALSCFWLPEAIPQTTALVSATCPTHWPKLRSSGVGWKE